MNLFNQLMESYRQGPKSVFALHPFIPLARMRKKGLLFNNILKNENEMAAAAMLLVEEGFDSTTLPFDMNVEAEILGGKVLYNEDVEGHPVYPTMGPRSIQTAKDIRIPDKVSEAGRMPVILKAIQKTRQRLTGLAGVGVFIPGPFTLAGQILDPDKMFIMVLTNPEAFESILDRLTALLVCVRNSYVSAGAQFVTVEEGGATAISPQSFEKLLLPRLKALFSNNNVPHVLSLTGRSDRFINLLLACNPDALGVDQACNLSTLVSKTPEALPIFCICGPYDMLAKATPDVVRKKVHQCMSTPRVFPLPPFDIYPPAKPGNLTAFVETARKG